MTDKEMYKKITVQLKYFNFKQNSISYDYLTDAIYLVTKEKKCIRNFKYFIYPVIARKYETRTENVMWGINKTISLMYQNTDKKIINQYFNLYYDNKPSPKAFIVGISNKLKEENTVKSPPENIVRLC